LAHPATRRGSGRSTKTKRAGSDGLTVGLYAGPIVQDYRLMPYDPGSFLRGAYAGGQIAADVWYRPGPATIIAFDGSIA
jgi:hypothetical protein